MSRLWSRYRRPQSAPEVHGPGPLDQDLLLARLPHLVQLEDGRQEVAQELADELVRYRAR